MCAVALVAVVVGYADYFRNIDPTEWELFWVMADESPVSRPFIVHSIAQYTGSDLMGKLAGLIAERRRTVRRFALWALMFLYPWILMANMLFVRGGEPASLDGFLFHLRRPLALPALNKVLYNGLAELKEGRDVEGYESKHFWVRLFNRHGVSTPKIYGYIKNGEYSGRPNPTESGDVIVKADRGCLGGGIDLVRRGKEIALTKYKGENGAGLHWVTERVYTSKALADHDCPQHFRVITCRDLKTKEIGVFDLCQYVERSKGSFKSNGGTARYGLDCRSVPDGSFMVDQAVKMHENLTPQFVAWDVMVTDAGPCFLEGNVVFGGLASYARADYTAQLQKLLRAARLF